MNGHNYESKPEIDPDFLPVEPRVKINLIGTGQILVKLQKALKRI